MASVAQVMHVNPNDPAPRFTTGTVTDVSGRIVSIMLPSGAYVTARGAGSLPAAGDSVLVVMSPAGTYVLGTI